MYNQDSFFDLSAWGQVGLAALSLTLFVAVVAASWGLMHGRGLMLRVVGALGLFWLFVWLSPQVYYMYYRMIIPDLPLQWVIWPPPSAAKPAQMLMFAYRDTLSAHGQGILGWGVIVGPFVRRFLVGR